MNIEQRAIKALREIRDFPYLSSDGVNRVVNHYLRDIAAKALAEIDAELAKRKIDAETPKFDRFHGDDDWSPF